MLLTLDTDSKGLRVATQPTAGTLAALVLLARRLEQVDHQILSDSPELPLELMKLYQSRWIQTLDAPDANMDNDTVCALLWDCILLDRLHPLDTSHSALSLLLKQVIFVLLGLVNFISFVGCNFFRWVEISPGQKFVKPARQASNSFASDHRMFCYHCDQRSAGKTLRRKERPPYCPSVSCLEAQ